MDISPVQVYKCPFNMADTRLCDEQGNFLNYSDAVGAMTSLLLPYLVFPGIIGGVDSLHVTASFMRVLQMLNPRSTSLSLTRLLWRALHHLASSMGQLWILMRSAVRVVP